MGATVAANRDAFRALLTEPIRFTPCVERGYRAIRFTGRIELAAMFGGEVVINLASPPGFEDLWKLPVSSSTRNRAAARCRASPSGTARSAGPPGAARRESRPPRGAA